MKYHLYAAGFVGKFGGDIKLVTSVRREALDWTRDNTKEGELSVMRGFNHAELEKGRKYMESVMVDNVIGFDGKYTEGYKYQLGLEVEAIRTRAAAGSNVAKIHPSKYWDDYYATN